MVDCAVNAGTETPWELEGDPEDAHTPLTPHESYMNITLAIAILAGLWLAAIIITAFI